jgi:hypothetical protein
VSKDPALELLVQLTNRAELEIPIILTLPGQVIAGTLISGRAFFAEVADEYQAGSELSPEEDLETYYVVTSMRAFHDNYVEPLPADNEGLPPADQIHLRRVWSIAPFSERWQPMWRGDLGKVVGWCLGAYAGAPWEDDEPQRQPE